MTVSQNDLILAHLQGGKPITPIDALELYGCFRLGARVWDLKRKGHPIVAETVTDKHTGKHYAVYRMAG